MPCLPIIKPARVRESFVSASRQRRRGSPVPLLPCHPECSRCRRPLPGCRPGRRSIVVPASFGGPHHPSSNPHLQDLRSWPVAGFEAIRIYYLVDEGAIRVIRILHGKRDVKRILEGEQGL